MQLQTGMFLQSDKSLWSSRCQWWERVSLHLRFQTLPSFSVSSPLASSYSVNTELVRPFFDTWKHEGNIGNFTRAAEHPCPISLIHPGAGNTERAQHLMSRSTEGMKVVSLLLLCSSCLRVSR